MEIGLHLASKTLSSKICIVGGGPAGLVLGLLTARAGIETIVLEKHADFLRDFRGDTVHPSTLEIFNDLGLLDALLKRPHQKAVRVTGVIGGIEMQFADFSRLRTRAKFVAFMPQHEFLDFVRGAASEYPTFHLHMETTATGLIVEDGVVRGVNSSGKDGPQSIRADLVVAADGRHSTIRDLTGFKVRDLGAPIDVLWMRVSRQKNDPDQPLGRIERGKMMAMLNRDDYWQCAYIIRKGTFDEVKTRGIPAFQAEIRELAPFLGDRVAELTSWDQVKLLTVRVDRLEEWARPGLLCIGDSAHAMSPVGGIGINLAIQDAVAAANILSAPLQQGSVGLDQLKKVQARREFPTRVTQALQVALHKRFLTPVLAANGPLKVPVALKIANRLPWLRRIPAQIMGVGIRPEKVRI